MPITINGSGPITGADGLLTLGTAVASTSGTAINFTGIPSWVKRVTVMFNEVSTNGTSAAQIQLGISSGIVASGYLGTSSNIDGTGQSYTNNSAGFRVNSGTAPNINLYGQARISLLGSNAWVMDSIVGRSDIAGLMFGAGSITLSGTLDRVRITTVNGTDTFDAGSINIMYE